MKNLRFSLLLPLFVLFACNTGKSPQGEAKDTPAETVVRENLSGNIPPQTPPPQKEISPTTPSAAQPPVTYTQYCNSRFGYCVEYPQGILYPQPESDNGDGRVFKNKKGEKILTVFGFNNIDNLTIQQQFDIDLHEKTEERTITYQKSGKNFFVISGYENGKIFYQKTILQPDDTFSYAILLYDETEKALYDPVATRVYKTFQ
ncbi:MAG: hypothetical protein K1X92_15420 [Bacteroidia bacterium]|nr:hypothetical protein [Bacteroidia bacterium]